MNGECQIVDQGLCGCCTGVSAQTPQPITNRPSLSQIAYRVGTYAQFKASMMAALSDPAFPALAGLRTRDSSDFTIALLDAFAVSADILTFYQERFANEAYLRTAVDQRSVFELAALVGYRPAPGVAASAHVAFALNNAPGSPDNVLIPAQTRVQSVPGPGQSPQVFETSRDIVSQIAQNALPLQTTVPWAPTSGDTWMWLQGTNNLPNAGDGLLFVGNSSKAADFHTVVSTSIDSTSGNTLVNWSGALAPAIASDMPVAVYAFRKKASLFGAQAPDPRTLSTIKPKPLAPNGDWDFEAFFVKDTVSLDAIYPGVEPVAGQDAWAVFMYKGRAVLYHVLSADEHAPMQFTLTSRTTRLKLRYSQRLYVNPRHVSQTEPQYLLPDIVRHTRNETVYVQGAELTPADRPYVQWDYTPSYPLDPGVLKPVEGSCLEIVGGQQLNSGQPVALFAKRLRLRATQDLTAAFFPEGGSAGLNVSAGDVFIITAFPPSTQNQWMVQTPSGVAGVLQINPGSLKLLAADKGDPVASEAAVINGITVDGTLALAQRLAGIYDRSTATVNVNVAPASHGETIHEILGNGDATNPALQFTLKQSPLTYVSSPVGAGAASTLKVWVNNLQWQEVGNFLSSGPNDRVFITHANSDGSMTVQFGDGITGERTPTGQMNIRAVYRKGIGSAGMVQTGQLTQPLDRPQGLQSATNPAAATGGADPDSAETARASAPLHVLTLNRVVSLEDYQNYSLTFQGIARSLATWTWMGRVRGVFLTVAGVNGSVFRATDPTIVNLIQRLHQLGNPFVPLQVASYSPVRFTIAAQMRIDTGAGYNPTQVLAAVWQGLSTAFGFAEAQLGQGIAQSQVIALIQNTPGVIAVEVTAFRRNDQPQGVGPCPAVLRAASPVAGQDGSLNPSEMLLLDPASQPLIVGWS